MTRLAEILPRIKNLEIDPKRMFGGTESGVSRSKQLGGGIEFSGVREYSPGDEARRVDWGVSARYGKLYVKEFVEEGDLSIYVVVDMSASTKWGFKRSKKELILELAISIMFSALRGNNRVGVGMFTNSLERFITAKKGKNHVMRIAEEVVSYKPGEKMTDIVGSLRELEKRIRDRGVVFVISDCISDSIEQMNSLKSRHHTVMVHISDTAEASIPDIGYACIEDMETGKQVIVNTSDAGFQEMYKRLSRIRKERLETEMKKAGIGLVEITDEERFEITFNRYVRGGNS